jgi:hypothetical protein
MHALQVDVASEEASFCSSSVCNKGDDGVFTTDNSVLLDVPADPFESHITGTIGMIPLAVMVFYSVSGGPFGVEASVRSAGNFYTLLGFLVMPLVWSLQEACMTAEL